MILQTGVRIFTGVKKKYLTPVFVWDIMGKVRFNACLRKEYEQDP